MVSAASGGGGWMAAGGVGDAVRAGAGVPGEKL